MHRRSLLLAILVLWSRPAPAQDDMLRLLTRPGAVGLLRHARAPGSGDPPGFRLGDCTTQRNLSDAGRLQARRAGATLRAAGLDGLAIYSSEWCRARETAELLALGPVLALPALNSFVSAPAAELQQMAEVRAFLEAQRAGPPRLLVTHQVNITALTGVYPAEGELVLLGPSADGYVLTGRVRLE